MLRAVAGLLRPDDGRIALDGEPWFDAREGIDLPPDRRSVGLVFQDYALFPHLTVRENVAFGGPAGADELLERLHLTPLAAAHPRALSGGERQRVALARALARDPAVLLLDEPLAALDAHTRVTVRAELQDVLGELGLPALLVTHDFNDAAALADRVGVIVDGRLRQTGTVEDLIERPADAFVAAFTGANLMAGEARPLPGGGAEVRLDAGHTIRSEQHATGRVGVVVHPWDLTLQGEAPANGDNAVPGRIAAIAPEGARLRVRVGELVAEAPVGAPLRRGEIAWATFAPARARLVSLGPEAADGDIGRSARHNGLP